jgi:predicted O-methyltransferase YrrM
MLEQLKKEALKNHVPIICDEGLSFLKQVIEKHEVKDVLEIGTAIGYSAIAMASFGCKVDTLERHELMIEEAKKNIEYFHMENQIQLIPEDAITYKGPLRSYDLIFLDAAKSQYKRFFEKYTLHLKPGGVVICDNLSFHHLDPTKVNRHTRQLLRKLKEFKAYLKEHPDFETTFHDEGDGMSISWRRI